MNRPVSGVTGVPFKSCNLLGVSPETATVGSRFQEGTWQPWLVSLLVATRRETLRIREGETESRLAKPQIAPIIICSACA